MRSDVFVSVYVCVQVCGYTDGKSFLTKTGNVNVPIYLVLSNWSKGFCS